MEFNFERNASNLHLLREDYFQPIKYADTVAAHLVHRLSSFGWLRGIECVKKWPLLPSAIVSEYYLCANFSTLTL